MRLPTRLLGSVAFGLACVGAPLSISTSASAQANANLAQRFFSIDDRASVAGFANAYAPSDAGYVRLLVARYRQNESTAVCTQRPRNFDGFAAAALSSASIARETWRNFLGENTISGTAVRIFAGANAEAAEDSSALADVIFNQVTIPRQFKNCRPEGRNGRAFSPLAPIASGTPTFAAQVRRWHTNTVTDEAIATISATVAAAGALAGLPVPIAERAAAAGSSIFRADVENSMGSRSAEVFNPQQSDGGRIVRVFTGYDQPTGPNPRYGRRREPEFTQRPFEPGDTALPYVDIGLVTVASLFDQQSASFEAAKARDAVQVAVDGFDILAVSLPNTPPSRDTLQEIFAAEPTTMEAISNYRQASTVPLLEDRCVTLAARLQDSSLGLSTQDANVVLLALAMRHQTFGEAAPDKAKRTIALSRPCMSGVKTQVEKLGVVFPSIIQDRQSVTPSGRAAIADRLNAASSAPSESSALNLVGSNLAAGVMVYNPQGRIPQMGYQQTLEPTAVADLIRRRYSAVGCSVPTGQESANVADYPIPSPSGDLEDRSLLTVLVSEDGQQRYAGIFQFRPHAPADAPTVRSITIQDLSPPLQQMIEAAYPGGCYLIPPPPPPPPPLTNPTPIPG